MTTQTIETDDTKLESTSTEPVAPSVRASGEAEVQPSVLATLVGRLSRASTRDRAFVVAGAAASILVAVFVFGFGATSEPSEGGQTREYVEDLANRDLPKPAPRLTTEEYLNLGKGALAEARLTEARRHLEAALASGPVDRRVRAQICQLMADVCLRSNQGDAAALYREEAATLLSGLSDTALAVFALAEADLAQGRVRAARRRFHAIALGGGQPGPVQSSLKAEAERRLARTYEAEFTAGHGGRLDAIKAPSVFKEVQR